MHFWKNKPLFVWLGGLLLGMVFCGIGSMGNQFETIWRKAVMICMECIGLG